MPGYELRQHIDRPVADVFDFVAVHHVENHPRWEPEVVSIHMLTEGPIRQGTRGVMVRRDFGPPREVPYEVTAFERDQVVAYRSVESSMAFDIAFRFAASGSGGTELGVVVDMEPHGAMRLLSPLLAPVFRRNGARLARRLKDLVEAEA